MFRKVPQPPIDPAARDPEHHDFWPGFVVAVIGLVLVVAGARRMTGVETVDGSMARETQLVKAFSFGGLQFPRDVAPPPPPKAEDPGASAEALDRWAREQANAQQPTWKVRVDTAARTPCPT